MYKQALGINGVIVTFTTFIGKRVAQMREWTKAELVTEPTLANMFIFAVLPKPLEARHMLFERCWYTLADDNPIALLGE
jgi:hypothetical protein